MSKKFREYKILPVFVRRIGNIEGIFIVENARNATFNLKLYIYWRDNYKHDKQATFLSQHGCQIAEGDCMVKS